MEKVSAFVIAGRSFRLRREDVDAAASGLLPEPVRDHYVVVRGIRFPPKQVIAAVTRLDRADFTTHQARAILRRLGFATGRLSREEPARRSVEESAREYGSREADELRPHRGRWVAVKDDRVLVAADSPGDVLAWLRENKARGDGMFRVPLDPAVDLGGFPG